MLVACIVLQLLLTEYSADIQSASAQHATKFPFTQCLINDKSAPRELPLRVRLLRSCKEPFCQVRLIVWWREGIRIFGPKIYWKHCKNKLPILWPRNLRPRLYWSQNRHNTTVWTDSRQGSRYQTHYCLCQRLHWTDSTGMLSPPTVWRQQSEFVSSRHFGQIPAAVCTGFVLVQWTKRIKQSLTIYYQLDALIIIYS